MSDTWHHRARRRFFLDFHISDWNSDFLSKFDPEQWAECIKGAHGTAATFMAITHTGLCTYPTAVGKVHACLASRDLLGEVIAALHRRDIAAIVYYCSFYTDWYYDTHPECRCVDGNGVCAKLPVGAAGAPPRFSLICMNNEEYRAFVVAQLRELCDNYEFEGIWPDMTFWPTVCYCRSCVERYRREAGAEIPRVVNWQDPAWVAFQRARQRWLLEYTHLVTSTIKERRPHVTVAHQSQTFCHHWIMGPSVDLWKEMDWLSADIYGEKYWMSFNAKLFQGMSAQRPTEVLNTWCWPFIHEHVVPRSTPMLAVNAASAMLNDSVYVFLDAIDPDGSIHTRHFDRFRTVFDMVRAHEPYLGGLPRQDVGVYFSFDADIDEGDNGRTAASFGYIFGPGDRRRSPDAHRPLCVNLCRTLMQHHITFGVITRKDLGRLGDFKVVVLPNVTMMSAEEGAAFRAYVNGGGAVYASKHTSLVDDSGRRQDDFMLGDLFGVSYRSTTEHLLSYVAPAGIRDEIFDIFDRQAPMTVRAKQSVVAARPGAQVMATITLPYTLHTEKRFASILTDPPGVPTEHPAVVLNRSGAGRVLYCSGAIEAGEHESQRQVVANLLGELMAGPGVIESDTHPSVEFAVYDQPENRRCVVHILSEQEQLPCLPVPEVRFSLRMGGRQARRAYTVPDMAPVEFALAGDLAHCLLPRLDMYRVVVVEY